MISHKFLLATFAIILYASISPNPIYAQNFTVVASDKSGDNTQGLDDIKSVSVAIDPSTDSLWFRIETYNPHSGDFGYGFGLDTDFITTNGHSWGGSNKSMKYDLAVYIDRDVIDTFIVYGGVFDASGNQLDLHFAPRTISPTIVEVNLKLSEIAPSKRFHLVAGSGSFDVSSTGSIYDDAPDKTYVTFDEFAAVSTDRNEAPLSNFYPNPANEQAFFDIENARILGIFDATGKNIPITPKTTATGFSFDLHSLAPGEYTTLYSTPSGISSAKMIVKR